MQTINYPGRAAERPKYGVSYVWDMPELLICPGLVQPAMEAANKQRNDQNTGVNLAYKRLGLAVVIQAIKDAVIKDDLQAEQWLQDEAPYWLGLIGFRVDPTAWQDWITAGYPGATDGRGFKALEEAEWLRGVSNQL